jgi:asparagine synthase (glutamine-hydrolysing)
MCGIAGYTGRWDSPTLARVEAALRHRGPDDFGSWVGDAISISNSRLAIIDIPGGRQPIFNEDRTAAIVFNGEIYNYRELRRRLEAAHTFQTDTDTEVILHLYEEVGSDVSSHLKVDFAFCIWDLVREECLLSRDHLGVKPLYYARTSGGGLAFSSELTALLGQPGVEAVVDPDAVVEYFTYLYIPAPRTLLRGVWKLQPGESLT